MADRKKGYSMVHIVGAGPGAADLITVRGARLLKEADVIIYAGSLVNRELLELARKDAQIYDSAYMTLEQVMEVIKKGWKEGREILRLHTGDPCVYGAIREQMDAMDHEGIPYEICPGVSSFCGAAAARDLPERGDHPDGGPDAGTGAGEHRILCGAQSLHGRVFKRRNAQGAVRGAYQRRISRGYTGGDCV